MIRLIARIEPVPFKRVSAGEGRRFNPRRYRAFKEELGWWARLAIKKPFEGPVSIRLKVYRQLPPESLKFGLVRTLVPELNLMEGASSPQ